MALGKGQMGHKGKLRQPSMEHQTVPFRPLLPQPCPRLPESHVRLCLAVRYGFLASLGHLSRGCQQSPEGHSEQMAGSWAGASPLGGLVGGGTLGRLGVGGGQASHPRELAAGQ